jgi:acetolactate synthase-1/2/3 large subunit
MVQADVVVCIGCGLSDVSTYGFNLAPRGEVFVADLDPLWDKKPVPCAMHVECDATDFALRLGQVANGYRLQEDWKAYIDNERKSWNAILARAESRSKPGFANPARFLRALERELPPDVILTAGQGVHLLYAYAFVRVRSSRSFLAATNMGAMGFVFPAALGAKIALPEREVVAIMGDGEFLMTMQDLETAVREKVGAKIVVVNDNSYKVLLMRQKIQKMGRVIGTTHSNPDIGKVAEAFGTEGLVVDSDDGVEEAVKFVTKKSTLPLLVELRVDPEDLPPLNIQGSLMF